MTFATPQLLWLLIIPAALALWELTRTRRNAAVTRPKILRAEAGADSLELSALNSQLSTPRRTRPRVWLFLGLALAVFALARPQYGRIDEPVFDQSREILLAVDLSRSMLTPDVKPSRLDRAKLLITSLLERLAGERLGLVVFSGTAFLQSPLSADYEILREFLPNLGPDFLPEGGTNYSALIQTSLAAFNQTASADRFLIILSDGEATDDTWRAAAEELKKKNIRVLGLGIGTASGAMIPDGPNAFVKDERGAVVLSKLEPATLRDLADLTGGVYRDASAWVDLASLIQSTVEAGQKGKFMEKNSVRLVERYQWPLAAALLCLVASFWREFPVRPKPRVLGAPRRTTPPILSPANTAALCFLLLSMVSSPLSAQLQRQATGVTESDPAAAPEKSKIENPESKIPNPADALTSIVTRLAAAPERSGRDWAELARETVNWGQRLQSGQQPVAPGPVNDALAAVTAGSALDPNTADWPKLREELNALLQKPDEKNQDDQKQDQEKKDQKDQNQSQDKNQQQQDKNKSKDDKSDPSQDQKGDPSQNSDDKNESKDSPENPDSKPPEGKDGQQAFGDMKDKESSPPPPPPEGDTQQVGGQPDQKPADANADPALAMPLQKLEQLRNQDSPAKLFRLMQGDPGRTPDKKGKNW